MATILPVIHVDQRGNQIAPPHAAPTQHFPAPAGPPVPQGPQPTDFYKGRIGKHHASLRQMMKPHAGSLISKEERAELISIQQRLAKLNSHAGQSSTSEYDKKLSELQQDYYIAPTDSAFKKLGEHTKSREEIAKRNNILQQAVYQQIDKLNREEVIPSCLVILKRVQTLLEKEILKLEATEKKLAESVEIPFEPSETLLSMANRLRNLRLQEKGVEFSVLREFVEL